MKKANKVIVKLEEALSPEEHAETVESLLKVPGIISANGQGKTVEFETAKFMKNSDVESIMEVVGEHLVDEWRR